MPGLTKRLYSNIVNYGVPRTLLMIIRKLLGRPAWFHSNSRIGNGFDDTYGVNTNLIVRLEHSDLVGQQLKRAEPHVPIEPGIFLRALQGAKIRYQDYHFVDVGSGLGRGLILAATLGFRKITGIELSEQLHRLAKDNLTRYRTRHHESLDVELLNTDALDYEFPKSPLCIYLYQPFKEAVVSEFLKRLELSILRNPGLPVTLVSVLTYRPALYREHAPSLKMVRDIEVAERWHCWQVFKAN